MELVLAGLFLLIAVLAGRIALRQRRARGHMAQRLDTWVGD